MAIGSDLTQDAIAAWQVVRERLRATLEANGRSDVWISYCSSLALVEHNGSAGMVLGSKNEFAVEQLAPLQQLLSNFAGTTIRVILLTGTEDVNPAK